MFDGATLHEGSAADEHDTSKPSAYKNNAVHQSSSDAINSITDSKCIATLNWHLKLDFFLDFYLIIFLLNLVSTVLSRRSIA